MGTWKHRISEIDEHKRTAICEVCGPCKIQVRQTDKLTGERRWRCNTNKINLDGFVGGKTRAYREFKGTECERCGFVAIDSCQLDVHHKDENNKNNDPANLETICANCHRLHHKTT